MKPNSFLVSICEKSSQPNIHCFQDNYVSLTTKNLNSHYIINKQEEGKGFSLFLGEYKPENQIDFGHPTNGTSILYDLNQKKLTIFSDLSGIEELYYSVQSERIILSNRLENLIDNNSLIDWSSIQSYLTFGYTLLDKTFFKNIKKTLPHQKIEVCVQTLRTSFSQDGFKFDDLERSRSHYLQKICKVYEDIIFRSPPMVLMMSAGWDSRTLLAPPNTKIVEAYTHGDLSSRETNLAKMITGSLRKSHMFTDLTTVVIDNSLLDEMLQLHGHCLWPVWHIAAKSIHTRLGLPIVSGAIGARLGGHSGFLSIGSRYRRTVNALHSINKTLVSENKVISSIESALKIPDSFWFLSEKGNELFKFHRNEANTDIHRTLYHYLNSSIDLNFAIERFNFDHRDRQYIAKQPQMARPFSGYRSPLSSPELLSVVYKTPFKYRIHNSMNRALIKKLNPRLLEYPMAATLAKAKRSILLQELSRVLRITIEAAFSILKKEKPRLGWFNYEHLYSGDFFQTTINSLESDLWSKERMLKKIETNQDNGIDAGSTMDMVCKIKTVDYYLSAFDKNSQKV